MRKKKLLLLLLVALLFSSCGKKHLDPSHYGADFQKKNEMLYMNEECAHFLIYTEADGSANGVDGNIYHAVYCKWSTCKETLRYEPHTLRVSNMGSARAQYKENGYMYHEISVFCIRCNATVRLNLLCSEQVISCMNAADCRKEIRWEELLCGTPYEISYD